MERVYKAIEGVWSQKTSNYEPFGMFKEGIQLEKYLLRYDDYYISGRVDEDIVEEFYEHKLIARVPYDELLKLKINSCITNICNDIYVDNSIEMIISYLSRRERDNARRIINLKDARWFGTCNTELCDIVIKHDGVDFMFDSRHIPFMLRIDMNLDMYIVNGHDKIHSSSTVLQIDKKLYI